MEKCSFERFASVWIIEGEKTINFVDDPLWCQWHLLYIGLTNSMRPPKIKFDILTYEQLDIWRIFRFLFAQFFNFELIKNCANSVQLKLIQCCSSRIQNKMKKKKTIYSTFRNLNNLNIKWNLKFSFKMFLSI